MKDENRNMALGYLETALMLKRSIAKLREKRANTKRLSDKVSLDSRIEALECNYYDNMFYVRMLSRSLYEEELESAKQADAEIKAPYIERAENQREQNRKYNARRKAKKKGWNNDEG